MKPWEGEHYRKLVKTISDDVKAGHRRYEYNLFMRLVQKALKKDWEQKNKPYENVRYGFEKEENKEDGTCEMIIFCYKCKSMWQLNPEMIACALITNATVWDVYNYILTCKCKKCEELCAQDASEKKKV